MASHSKRQAVLVFVLLLCLARPLHARKLLDVEAREGPEPLAGGVVSPRRMGRDGVADGSMARPGRVSPVGRMLGSEPSPGVGH